jgi:hypothetical protein
LGEGVLGEGVGPYFLAPNDGPDVLGAAGGFGILLAGLGAGAGLAGPRDFGRFGINYLLIYRVVHAA